jgi:tetratricopeptide (TPR) repeat protein
MTSASAAYRKDLAANGSAFGEQDGAWITVVSLVTNAAECAALDEPDVDALGWDSAIAAATQSLGSSELDRLSAREWGSGRSAFDPLTLLSLFMHELGARELSTLLLDGVLRVRRHTQDIAYGRALAQRARVAYLAGEHEVAEELYRRVDVLGRRLGSAELRARAANGFAGLAQVRGNHPQMLEAATRGLALAEQTEIPRLRWNARYTIMASTALFHRFDDALAHGWELFNLGRGDVLGESLALQSLGQLLLEMGDADSARAAFAAVVSRPLPAYVLLAALGSLANATALVASQRQTLEWSVAEIEGFRDSAPPPWAYASALLDCVVALRDAGDVDRAKRLRDELLAIAGSHGFHALQYRAESITFDVVSVPPQRAVVAAPATEIVRSVRRLAPRRLPRHVMVPAARA